MVTTRASKVLAPSSQSTAAAVPPELRIDGTAALLGTQRQLLPQSGPSYKAGGARWQDVAAASSGADEDDNDDDDNDDNITIALPPRRKRKRQDDTPAADGRDDQRFLDDARRQYKRLRPSAEKAGRHDVGKLLPYLDHVQQPAVRRTLRQQTNGRRRRGAPADAYVLSSAEARQFIQSDAAIDAPVFVAEGANTAHILDAEATARPIEQLLDWFPDPSEQFDGDYTTPGQPTLTEARQRFLHHNNRGAVSSPWNLPDMAFPFADPGVPSFLPPRTTNLLRDTVRYLIGASPDILCPAETCPTYDQTTRHCSQHFLTTAQYGEVVTGWQHWQGTVLLAQAGALTLPHVDQWGVGTWMSCLEGEMGFAWQSGSSDAQVRAVQRDSTVPDGRWVYKVLRPGDTLYMGPGTPHLVFRLPGGGQTGAIAGHVVRRQDLELWLRALLMTAQSASEDGEGREASFPDVLVSLVDGIEHHIDQTKATLGAAKAKRMANTIKKLRGVIEKL